MRLRVRGYRAGDLERRYASLAVEEDTFVNYGFLTRANQALMHPRVLRTHWSPAVWKRARALIEFVRERGEARARDVDPRFAPGRVKNGWGGSSSAVSQLLDELHYRGLLRVTRRENGLRVYGVQEHGPAPEDVEANLDALVDLVVEKYAPLPATSLSTLVSRLRYAAPQHTGGRRGALDRARKRLGQARIDGVDWYWPAKEQPHARSSLGDEVRLLAPFDPLVWDRRRFEKFWGWAYRFEAYTPVQKRKLGYYALPLLWHEELIGWGNLAQVDGALKSDFGFVSGKVPRAPAFRRELEAELDRIRRFLTVG